MTDFPSRKTVFNAEEQTRTVYRNWRERFAAPLLIGSLFFGLIILIPAVSTATTFLIKAIFIGAYIVTAVITFIPFPYWVKMSAFLLIIYVLGLSELASSGILGDSLLFFLALIIFSTMMFSPRLGMISIALNTLTIGVFGWLTLTRAISPLNGNALSSEISDWISAGGILLLFGLIIILGFQRLNTEFFEAQKQIDVTLEALEDERNNLDNKVKERTSQLRRVNEIGRSVTSILDPDELLARAVQLIGNEFECYYTAIYLIDITGRWAEIKEATGEAGKVLRENRHRVDISGKNIVGTAIRDRQIRIAPNSGNEPAHLDNPLLPYTRSLIVMPLLVRDKVLGALELHSEKENAFSQQDVETYLNIANEIAIAFENSHLFREAQQSLTEMRATQRQYLKSAWYSATSENELQYQIGNASAPGKGIEIPMALRDQIIGQIHMASGDEWTAEQKNLIESIATQAALALENARLVEESQSIASRERLANEIIAKVWASATMDAILQTTVRELGRTLEAAEVDIEVSMGRKYE